MGELLGVTIRTHFEDESPCLCECAEALGKPSASPYWSVRNKKLGELFQLFNNVPIFSLYNHEKDRVTIEETFHRLMELMDELDEKQKRAVAEGLDEDELALFDLLKKDNLPNTERERVKQASRNLLSSIKTRLSELERFWEKEQTKADVEVFILDQVYASLPTPPFTAKEKEAAAAQVYAHVWQQAVSGGLAQVA